MHVQVTPTQANRISALGRRRFSDRDYLRFCEENPDLNVERTAAGEIVIVPPAGYESDECNASVVAQLKVWADKDGRGRVSGPTAQFFLPDGSARSPDAAWTSHERLSRASSEEMRRFPYLCPEFVIEVLSPSDRLSAAKAKMEQWIANGAQLAWLIDADRETVYVYEAGRPVEIKKGIARLHGKGPVGPHRAAGSALRRSKPGFVLQLRTIWEGLK